MELIKKQARAETSVVNASDGIVQAIVGVTGNVDASGDVIIPGTFARALEARTPVGIAYHDWNKPVAKTVYAEELMPGDSRLPGRLQENGWGGVLVEMQFNLDAAANTARETFSTVKHFGDEQEWSIGFYSTGEASDEDGNRVISEIDWLEYSPVIAGMNPETVTVAVKTFDVDLANLDRAAEAITRERQAELRRARAWARLRFPTRC